MLTLTSSNANSIKIEQYPGLYIYRNLPQNPDGSFQDITVTDGSQTRTFTPDRLAPMVRTFVRRAEPILTTITNPTNYAVVSGIVPVGLYTLWGSNFTSNDPAVAT